jgi:hypothetical protein
MSPAILSVCLLANLTRPLSPAERWSRPEPSMLSSGLYAVRTAFTVQKGMPMKEVWAILGKQPTQIVAKDFGMSWRYDDL